MISYISTRGPGEPQTFEQVLLAGLAPDGGLYVPKNWPTIDLAALKGKPYAEIAEAVMFPFVEGSIDHGAFKKIIAETYSDKIFRPPGVAPLHRIYPNCYVMELFHGPTLAFKDVALQLLGRLFDYVLTKRNEHITIVGATSGDTGSAAIEGCRYSDYIDIFMLHPKDRVSDVQRRQMTTVQEPNVHNIALDGTFDDCQDLVKAMFSDKKFRREMNLSAVNSINWARIMAQIVYYVSAALELGAPEKEISFVVPTGNFGNVFAGYAARKMGLPIKTLSIATNRNDILTRFFETGEMRVSDVQPSLSPSMDIQISSNFERYLFDVLGRDAKALKKRMEEFRATGILPIPEEERNDIRAFRADDAQTLETIKKIYNDTGYILDPHTAVGVKGALELVAQQNGIVVTLGTAHPAKFPDAVEKAIGLRPELPDFLSNLHTRPEYRTILPNKLEILKNFVRQKI